MGDPGPLGLAAFALTTFVLSVVNAGIMPTTAKPVVFGLALFFGGFVQVCAGILEFFKNNTFGGVAFSSYGAFWMAFWYLSTTDYLAKSAGADAPKAVGLFLLGWTIFTLYMTICVSKVHNALLFTFIVLSIAFICLTLGDFLLSTTWTHLGGWFGLAAAAGAWYCSFASIYNGLSGRVVIPLGPRN